MLLFTNKDFYYTLTILRVKSNSLIMTLLYALSCNKHCTIHFETIEHLYSRYFEGSANWTYLNKMKRKGLMQCNDTFTALQHPTAGTVLTF